MVAAGVVDASPLEEQQPDNPRSLQPLVLDTERDALGVQEMGRLSADVGEARCDLAHRSSATGRFHRCSQALSRPSQQPGQRGVVGQQICDVREFPRSCDPLAQARRSRLPRSVPPLACSVK